MNIAASLLPCQFILARVCNYCTQRIGLHVHIFAIAALGTVALSADASSTEEGALKAFTRPSQDVELRFLRPGRIAQVMVKRGDTVKAGDLLVQLDDEAERTAVELQKAVAEDTARVKAAKADRDQKRVDFKKLKSAFEKGVATEWELDHARLDVTISELSVQLATLQHSQEVKKLHETLILLERMKLRSSIDGKVDDIVVEAGESVDAQSPVARVVNIDPLWIDVAVPLKQMDDLEPSGSVVVKYVRAGKAAHAARIQHIKATADPASETLGVLLELPNPEGRPSGEHVHVLFAPRGRTDADQKASGRNQNAYSDSRNSTRSGTK